MDRDAEVSAPIELVHWQTQEHPRGAAALWVAAVPFVDRTGAGLDRVLLSLEPRTRTRPMAKRLGDRARARFLFALEPEDLGSRPPALDAERLTVERHLALAHTPEPALTVEDYAAVAAAVADSGSRADTLARHDFDELAWTLEERAWLAKMAEGAMAGDVSTAVRFGELFVAAQDALGAPEEADAMVHEYVGVRVAFERETEPQLVIERWGMTLAQWLRLDRYFQRRARQNPLVATELERLLDAERHRVEPDPDPASDPAWDNNGDGDERSSTAARSHDEDST
jgi:hypothetical protein